MAWRRLAVARILCRMRRLYSHPLYLLTGKHRSLVANQRLGRVLGFIAGFVNAGGFFIVHQYTSHMTGIISIAADSIALGRYVPALLMLGYIAFFIFGAAATTVIVITARRRNMHSQYALPLLLEAVLILLIVALSVAFVEDGGAIPALIASLCFLMGLQNALITKASTAVIRTTHITGMSTDLGIELGRALLATKQQDVQVNKAKASLHLSIIGAFFAGGIVGAVALAHQGVAGLLPVAGLLVAVSIVPVIRDFGARRSLKRRRNVR